MGYLLFLVEVLMNMDVVVSLIKNRERYRSQLLERSHIELTKRYKKILTNGGNVKKHSGFSK